MKEQIITCGHCARYNANQAICNILKKKVSSTDTQFVALCKEERRFIHYLPLLPFYFKDGHVQICYDELAKDRDGIPLFVITKRGIERAIPAYHTLELKGNSVTGVELIFTYQGQNEFLYKYGALMTKKICEKHGIYLYLPKSEYYKYEGDPLEIKKAQKIYHVEC